MNVWFRKYHKVQLETYHMPWHNQMCSLRDFVYLRIYQVPALSIHKIYIWWTCDKIENLDAIQCKAYDMIDMYRSFVS